MKRAANTVSLMRRFALVAVFAASLAQATPLEVKVMTQNMYFGTDFAPLATATPATLPFIVAAGFAEVVASNPAGRIARIADVNCSIAAWFSFNRRASRLTRSISSSLRIRCS
jgi:hypothetical protein